MLKRAMLFNTSKFRLFLTVVLLFSLLFCQTTVSAQEQAAPVNNNMSVSAVVPPGLQNYQFAITASEGGTVNQNTEIAYQITYGADEDAGVGPPTTITANWRRDTGIDGTHLFEYVTGSAENAFGNV